MRLNTLLIICTFCFTYINAQSSFKKGYYITLTGERTECYIKDFDWRYTPSSFYYKLSLEGKKLNTDLESLSEFGCYGEFKYIRANVDIDMSSMVLNELSTTWEPKLVNKSIFLKLLLQGDASLYEYTSNNFKRYFFSLKTEPITQLIYKEYVRNGEVLANNSFRDQLLEKLKAPKLTYTNLQKVNYDASDLIGVFKTYNESIDGAYDDYSKKKNDINFMMKLGLQKSYYDYDNSSVNYFKTNYNSEYSFRFGFEVEFIMGFHNNKWSAFIEPSYQYYKSESVRIPSTSAPFERLNVSVNYNSIEIPIGIRHYMFLNNTSKLFLSAAHITDFTLNSEISYGETKRNIEILNRLGLGIGYNHKSTYSIELRWVSDFINEEELGEIVEGSYSYLSLTLGYRLFKI